MHQLSNDSILNKALNPILQAGLVFGCFLFFATLGMLTKWTGLMDVKQTFPWLLAGTFLLFFAIFNALLSLNARNMDNYWGRSVLSYVGLAALSGSIAWLFSSLSINEAGPYKWIFIVLTFGYLVFLSMIRFMRNIVNFAQKEEWNHPRVRKKGRR